MSDTKCAKCGVDLSEFGAEMEWCDRLERLVNVEPFTVHDTTRCLARVVEQRDASKRILQRARVFVAKCAGKPESPLALRVMSEIDAALRGGRP